MVFGVALLCEETAKSYSWLFLTLIKARGGKKLVKIFTNQDAKANA